MNIKWYGQAAFLITSGSGLRIITDPFAPNENLTYGEIAEPADIITVSHDHFDHNNVAGVKGKPVVMKASGEAKEIKFRGIAAFHDEAAGKQRGSNMIFCFSVDGISLCHLGDLGHPLSEKQVAEIGKVDILMIPVGGNYTIDAKVAGEVSSRLSPKIIIPMHFKNDRIPKFPVSTVDDFLKGKRNVTKLEVSEVEFKSGILPASAQIVVLKPAR
jgi:L-ascorbate metabolism protein UlaG (beta-lactamase superfamily)